MKDNNSLAHSTWNCKYYLVFAPKYIRMQIYGQIRKDIGVILRRLCEQKRVEIIINYRAVPLLGIKKLSILLPSNFNKAILFYYIIYKHNIQILP